MEIVLIRFPRLGQQIFKELDDKSIEKCRGVNQFQKNFLDNDSLLWKRKIKKYIKHFAEFKKDWELVTKKVTTDFLKNLSNAVERIFTNDEWYNEWPEEGDQYSPLQIAAENGVLSLYESISKRIGISGKILCNNTI